MFIAHSSEAEFKRLYKKTKPKPPTQHMTKYESDMHKAYLHSISVQKYELQVQYNKEKQWHRDAIEQAERDKQQLKQEFNAQFEGLSQTPVHSRAEIAELMETTPPVDQSDDGPEVDLDIGPGPDLEGPGSDPEADMAFLVTPKPKKTVTWLVSDDSDDSLESLQPLPTPQKHKQLTLPLTSTPTKGAAQVVLQNVRQSLFEQVDELSSGDEEGERSLLSRVADIKNIQNLIKQQIDTSEQQPTPDPEPELMITYGEEGADLMKLKEIEKHLKPISTLADGNCLYRAIAVSKHPQGILQPGKVGDWPLIKNQIIEHHQMCPIHHTCAAKADTELESVMAEGAWASTLELEAYCHLKGMVCFLRDDKKWKAINANERNNPDISGVMYLSLSCDHFSGFLPLIPNLHQLFFEALNIHRMYAPTTTMTTMPAIAPPPKNKYPLPGAPNSCVSDILGEIKTDALKQRFKRAYAKIVQYIKHKWTDNWVRCLYGYKCSNLYLDRQTVELLSQTLFIAVHRDREEIEAPFWWLVSKLQSEEQLSIKICQHEITPDTVTRAFEVPKWRLQEMYHGVALSALSRPTRQQFKQSQIICLKIKDQTLTYSFDQGQDLLLAAATVTHRHPETPVPEVHSNWHYWSTHLKAKLAVNFFADIGTDKHFDLKVEGDASPFLLPIFSM